MSFRQLKGKLLFYTKKTKSLHF